jgi:hypothetical protein
MAGKNSPWYGSRWRAAIVAVLVLVIFVLLPLYISHSPTPDSLERSIKSVAPEPVEPLVGAAPEGKGQDLTMANRGNLQGASGGVRSPFRRGQISNNPLIAKAQELLRLELSQAERKKARVLQYKNTGIAKVWLIAIPAPDEKDIGAAANKLSQILRSIPEDKKAEARTYLQLTYDDYMRFGHPYRLIHVIENRENPAPESGEVELNSLEGVILTEKGGISSKEEQNYVLPGTSFKIRYSHLGDILNER